MTTPAEHAAILRKVLLDKPYALAALDALQTKAEIGQAYAEDRDRLEARIKQLEEYIERTSDASEAQVEKVARVAELEAALLTAIEEIRGVLDRTEYATGLARHEDVETV